MHSCGILIPAYNEEAFIGSVVEAALTSALGSVLVVDDGSQDATAEAASRAGAEVLRLRGNRGKGGAVYAGAKHLQSKVIVLLDADLTGLTAAHIRDLAAPVMNGEVEMARGVFAGGRWRTTTAQRLTPQLNGQRAILRSRLLEVKGLTKSRYGIEIAITNHAKRAGWISKDVPMQGVSQVMKEEKRGFWTGFWIRLKMYRDILRTYLKQSR